MLMDNLQIDIIEAIQAAKGRGVTDEEIAAVIHNFESPQVQTLHTQMFILRFCGVGVTLMPYLLYVGEIACRLLQIQPPDMRQMLQLSMICMGSIVAFGFPGVRAALPLLGKKDNAETK